MCIRDRCVGWAQRVGPRPASDAGRARGVIDDSLRWENSLRLSEVGDSPGVGGQPEVTCPLTRHRPQVRRVTHMTHTASPTMTHDWTPDVCVLDRAWPRR
eukprot:4288477-Prymnesium_polylepis.1